MQPAVGFAPRPQPSTCILKQPRAWILIQVNAGPSVSIDEPGGKQFVANQREGTNYAHQANGRASRSTSSAEMAVSSARSYAATRAPISASQAASTSPFSPDSRMSISQSANRARSSAVSWRTPKTSALPARNETGGRGDAGQVDRQSTLDEDEWRLWCASIRSGECWRGRILVMQPTQHRRGLHHETLTEPISGFMSHRRYERLRRLPYGDGQSLMGRRAHR